VQFSTAKTVDQQAQQVAQRNLILTKSFSERQLRRIIGNKAASLPKFGIVIAIVREQRETGSE